MGRPLQRARLTIEGVVPTVFAAGADQPTVEQVEGATEVVVDGRRVALVGTEVPHVVPVAQGDGPDVLTDAPRRGLVSARAGAEEHEAVLDVDRRRTPDVGAARPRP